MKLLAQTTMLLILLALGYCDHHLFSYEGSHGPTHWGDDYNTCIGKHQSPINIVEHQVKDVTYPTLKFLDLDAPRSVYMTNNGHTVMIKMNDSRSTMITGGPLDENIYLFEQLHFHWGENDTRGSEDTINNHSYAMELHAVFYKKNYNSIEEATRHPDGLTVLAYFFEVGEEPNQMYQPLVDRLEDVHKAGQKAMLQSPLLLKSLLLPYSSVSQNYFTYNGSLTTPPCSEVVTWIDFKEPLLLSHEQLAQFREIQSEEGQKLTHNFRPVQPLEDRVVYHNVPESQNMMQNGAEESDGAFGRMSMTTVAFLGMFSIILSR